MPADILTLTLGSGVGGIAASVAATANAFDLAEITTLSGLSGVPTTAQYFRLRNSDGTAFALNLSAHNSLIELSLNSLASLQV